MRWFVLTSVLLSWGATGCFVDSKPVEDGGDSTGSGTGTECIAGTEGCPCIDGECVGGLSCLSNTCVDAGMNDSGTTGSMTSTTRMSDSTISTSTVDGPDAEVDSTPDDTTPVSDGPPPPDEMCDPIQMTCEDGLHCHASQEQGQFFCEQTLGFQVGEPCFDIECDYGLACVSTQALLDCPSEYCCTYYCDLFNADMQCPEPEMFCAPVFGFEFPPPPGYDHVGACVYQDF